MAKKSSKMTYLAALVLFLGGVGYLAYSGFSENSVYFLNVSEALAAPAEKMQQARLFGTVATEDLTIAPDGRSTSFRLQDQLTPSAVITVDFKGAIPDTFKAGAEVIVEGGLTGPGRFNASTLMTKCPSKYQKENRG